VRRAFDAITASAREHAADARIRGVTVAPMRSGGVELLVGVVRDPQWGPVLALGLGGVFVEVLQDAALRRLPVGTAEIRRMLESLRGGRVLEGFRGAAAADLDAVAHAVHATTQVFLGLGDQIDELEINPLIVDGSRVEAVDALITWHDA
jgi:succinyl-CoA synthetase beta subunit